MRRAGRPGLIGLAARTAVVAGTANAVNARAGQRQQAAAQQQELAAAQQQAQIDAAAQAAAQQYAAPAAPAPAPAAPAAPTVDIVAELQKLGTLKEAGLLDDAEFAAAKARLLA